MSERQRGQFTKAEVRDLRNKIAVELSWTYDSEIRIELAGYEVREVEIEINNVDGFDHATAVIRDATSRRCTMYDGVQVGIVDDSGEDLPKDCPVFVTVADAVKHIADEITRALTEGQQ